MGQVTKGGRFANCFCALIADQILPQPKHAQRRQFENTAEGAIALAQSPVFSKLTSLNMVDNRIGDEGALAIADSDALANLTYLHLQSDCPLTIISGLKVQEF